MTKNLKILLYWCPTIITLIIIFYFSSRTGSQSNAQSDPIAERIAQILNLNPNLIHTLVVFVRKSAHVFIYTVLSLSTTFALVKISVGKGIYLKSFGLDYIFAVFDEIHQYFVPGRSGMFVDTLIDSGGILIGIFIFVLLRRLKKRQL